MSVNYKKLVQEVILDEKTFVKATFSGSQKKNKNALIKAVVRPVVIKEKQLLQFSYLDSKKDITKNFTSEECIKKLHQVLQQGFRNITIQTTDKTVQVEIPLKGKALIHEHAVTQNQPIELAHDQKKSYILPADRPNRFLEVIGIMTKEGKVKADRYSKFRQINEFLKILDQTINPLNLISLPLSVIDFGCGNGYLTFALYYYLNEILKKPATVVGIDRQADLLKKLTTEAEMLEWKEISFKESTIKDFRPTTNADIVIALHACDTATDEALAQAIHMNSSLLFTSPCCHHNIQEQLKHVPVQSLFHPVFQHAILGERFGDILTDTFRSLILQIMGYKTDIIEFISSEHTAKNLMIRAVKLPNVNNRKYIHEYKTLKHYWKVTPHLEKLLGKEFTQSL